MFYSMQQRSTMFKLSDSISSMHDNGHGTERTPRRVENSRFDERKIDRIEERLSAIEGLLRARLPVNGFQGPPASSSSSTGPGAMSQQIPIRTATAGSSCAGTTSTPNAALKNSASDSHCSSPLDFDSPATYEGGSSLTAQSTLAGEFFEKAVLLGRTPGFYGDGGDDEINARMRDALASLKQMVAMQRENASADELTPGCSGRNSEEGKVGGEDGALQKLEMPPMPAVLAILKRIKESNSRVFEDDMAFLDMEEFIGLCKNVYFATEEFSEATFIIVNAGLYHMFASEFDATDDEGLREQYCAYEDQCQSNLDAAFLRLPLCLPATMMNIKALLFGTMHTIGYVCKPKLAWTLITTAARMVLTLGFHRIDNNSPASDMAMTGGPAATSGTAAMASMAATPAAAATTTPGAISAATSPAAAATASTATNGKTNIKVLIFWYVYTIEKALALRLGYSSVIRDHDITIPYTLDTSVQPGPFSGLVNAWVKLAVIQSRAYEQLYSPQALAQPREVTVSCARGLGRQLEAVMDEAKRARDALAEAVGPDSKYTGSLDMQLKGDEIICYTTLTLIYRALPAPEGSVDSFDAQCVEAARRVLEIHQECMAATADNMHLQVSQIHWSVLLTPFAPFFVIFCQTISTSSSADLALIQAFAASLIPASEYSEPVKRLQRLCDVFCKVAAVYLEAKARASQVGDQDMMQIGNEFDMYFGALGLMQHQQQPMVQPQWNGPHHHQQQQQQQQQQQHHQQQQQQQQFAPVQHQQQHPQHQQQDVQNMGMMMPGFDMGLGDWYAGSRSIMGLLEGDMSTFGMPPEAGHGHGHGHGHIHGGHMG
ncbi:hypothetical protein MCOR30_007993 [Pyricularia oryzae]|nr:hypothetical protein MCOR30_007993 [Pyricularia oryzae]KAI6405336.1 hypothetical protein MCOR24_007880 [Pyricularia oryzae]KAI6594402.1 hypothetical protein MCOR12_006885 [Pyricularia oryzae]